MASLCTTSPASSNPGCWITARRAPMPIWPGPHSTTRATSSPEDRQPNQETGFSTARVLCLRNRCVAVMTFEFPAQASRRATAGARALEKLSDPNQVAASSLGMSNLSM